jgi:hypothetical protein
MNSSRDTQPDPSRAPMHFHQHTKACRVYELETPDVNAHNGTGNHAQRGSAIDRLLHNRAKICDGRDVYTTADFEFTWCHLDATNHRGLSWCCSVSR